MNKVLSASNQFVSSLKESTDLEEISPSEKKLLESQIKELEQKLSLMGGN